MDKAVDQLVRYSIHNGTGVPGVSPQGRPVIVRYSTASSRKASITPSLKQIQQYLIREVSVPTEARGNLIFAIRQALAEWHMSRPV